MGLDYPNSFAHYAKCDNEKEKNVFLWAWLMVL